MITAATGGNTRADTHRLLPDPGFDPVASRWNEVVVCAGADADAMVRTDVPGVDVDRDAGAR